MLIQGSCVEEGAANTCTCAHTHSKPVLKSSSLRATERSGGTTKAMPNLCQIQPHVQIPGLASRVRMMRCYTLLYASFRGAGHGQTHLDRCDVVPILGLRQSLCAEAQALLNAPTIMGPCNSILYDWAVCLAESIPQAKSTLCMLRPHLVEGIPHDEPPSSAHDLSFKCA